MPTASERREAAKTIKRWQEAALEALPQRKLYIGLWLRDINPEPNNFHWGFYHHINKLGGTKYHMTNVSRGWIAGHGTTGGVFKSIFLCVLIQIGSIPAVREEEFDRIMRSYDDTVNSIPGVTCRVWIFTILPHLIEAGLLHCEDLDALQKECFDFGNAQAMSAVDNKQPRPVMVSSTCF